MPERRSLPMTYDTIHSLTEIRICKVYCSNVSVAIAAGLCSSEHDKRWV